MPLFDLSHPLGPRTPVFPGEKPLGVRLTADCRRGDAYTLRQLGLTTHSGTHVDAPAHLFPDGATLDQLPLALWAGPAPLLDACEFEAADLVDVERLLLAGCPDGIPRASARRIVGAGVRLLGLDGPSADPVSSADLPSHRLLLGAGGVIVENLRLEGVPLGRGRVLCLPLPVEEGDGAPCRVLWEPEGI